LSKRRRRAGACPARQGEPRSRCGCSRHSARSGAYRSPRSCYRRIVLPLLDLVARLVGAPFVVLPIGGAPLALLLVGAVGVAGLAALALTARVVSTPTGSGAATGPFCAAERIELPTRIAQSDPDAAGHIRSRAPGRRLPTALALPGAVS
jgi:hypothetical protein